ncbi:hypothetical protein C479_03895 [Halovivax asiaticus JCM 14624]|uniref:Uncharacterized protein n=1 Tax=Halovivax asiaticus JCM 14624 TaxID=1227490 RepID=M0BQS0_9EURY|nr:hypothetical protein [Halovivax asiaticus]ELZ12748.1 hypothetical protein C479_03895 [Halovivax asiaticus JCM 14624]
MTIRTDDATAELEVTADFDGGFSWIAHPDERMQRASHALVVDDAIWVIDPVDGDGLDELLAERGSVAGVVVGLDRHKRDAAAIATRHDVAVWLPDWFDGVESELDAPVRRFGAELADTGIRSQVVTRSRFWQEVALFDPATETLVVPESVGTASYFRTDAERLGVHPARRLWPPRKRLSGFDPHRVLVGHGAGIETGAGDALDAALAGSRRRSPTLYASILRAALPL